MDDKEDIDESSSEEFLMCDLVTVIYKSYRNYLMYKLTDLNITPAQIPFILELVRAKKASQDELANKLFLTRGTTAKALRKLDDEKIIERKTAANNRRKYDVYLTEKGKETALKIEKIDRTWEDLIFSYIQELEDFKDEDKEKVTNLLKALAESSIGVFAQEKEKFEDSDGFNDNNQMPPFSGFHFRGHPFRGSGFHRGFFGKRGPFRNDRMKKF